MKQIFMKIGETIKISLINSLLKSVEGKIIANVATLAAEAATKAAAGTSKEELVGIIANALNSSIDSERPEARLLQLSFLKSEYDEIEEPNPQRHRPTLKESDSGATTTTPPDPTMEAPSARTSRQQSVANSTPKPKGENMTMRLIRFMQLHYAFRYNVLTRTSEVCFLDEGSEYVVAGRRERNTIVVDAQMEGLNCWDKDVTRIIESRATKSFHPFIDYMDRLPQWDGVDRVTELVKRVSDNPVWTKYSPIWLRAMVAQWMGDERMTVRANSMAPVIVSSDQGWGKSTFARILMPPELRTYFSENFNVSGNSCEAKLADLGLINMDEFDRMSARNMANLKNLMQQSEINTPLKHQNNITPRRRLASFIATSNSRDLLTDGTGSRRFLVVELRKPIDCDTPIDYRQLYAQLKREIAMGLPVYFDKAAEREIQENNRPYRRISPEEEAIRSHFRMAKADEEGATLMSALQIYRYLLKHEKRVMRDVALGRVSRILSEMGGKQHTMYGNVYCVVKI